MKRSAPFLLLLLCGCSTAPLADFLDLVKPGRIDTSKPFYGGVGASPAAPPVVPSPPVPVTPPP